MYVLHDVNLQNADLKAQVDYIIITKVCALPEKSKLFSKKSQYKLYKCSD